MNLMLVRKKNDLDYLHKRGEREKAEQELMSI